MSDRLLAVSLALVLALPLLVSLDGDLFDQSRFDQSSQAGPPIDGERPADASDDAILSGTAREAARRFHVRALEGQDDAPQEPERSLTWRHDPPMPQGTLPPNP